MPIAVLLVFLPVVNGGSLKTNRILAKLSRSRERSDTRAHQPVQASGGLLESAAAAVEDGTTQLNIGEDVGEPCGCEHCKGERLLEDTNEGGYKGFQCGPDLDVQGQDMTCDQSGDSKTWVVQTATTLTYSRYCHLNCKPLVPEKLTAHVSCTKLNVEEAAAAQTSSGNGRAFVWRSNPMVDTLTMEEIMSVSELPRTGSVVGSAAAAVDPALATDVAFTMRTAFRGSQRRRAAPLWFAPVPPHCCCQCACACDGAAAAGMMSTTQGPFILDNGVMQLLETGQDCGTGCH